MNSNTRMKIDTDSPFDPPDLLTMKEPAATDVALYLAVRNGHQKTWGLLYDNTVVVPKSTGGQNHEK